MKKIRHYIFLKDVLVLTLSAFGGPQAHFTLFLDKLVKKRAYLTEEELIELNSFCQILPGPASTQTLTAVGFKIGGPRLAFLTLLIWILPSITIMTLAAIGMTYMEGNHVSLIFTRFIQPMAVGFVMFAAYKISSMVVKSKTSYAIFIASAVFCYFVSSPAIFPIILIIGGLITSVRFKRHPLETEQKQEKYKIDWANLILFAAVLFGAALLGRVTHALPIRLFENFFRNGSLIFGGGDALTALFYKEFVVFKHYLNNQEFLTGFAIQKALPGPLFSFSSYIGALSMRQYGVPGEILGGIVAAAGVFLPGTILIFFLIRFWDKLKQYRAVKASLEGVNAASAGVVTATALILFWPMMDYNMELRLLSYGIIAATFSALTFTKMPPPYIILIGLLAGLIF